MERRKSEWAYILSPTFSSNFVSLLLAVETLYNHNCYLAVKSGTPSKKKALYAYYWPSARLMLYLSAHWTSPRTSPSFAWPIGVHITDFIFIKKILMKSSFCVYKRRLWPLFLLLRNRDLSKLLPIFLISETEMSTEDCGKTTVFK